MKRIQQFIKNQKEIFLGLAIYATTLCGIYVYDNKENISSDVEQFTTELLQTIQNLPKMRP